MVGVVYSHHTISDCWSEEKVAIALLSLTLEYRILACWCSESCFKTLTKNVVGWMFSGCAETTWRYFVQVYGSIANYSVPFVSTTKILFCLLCSASFLAEISVSSPRKLFIFIIQKILFWIKVSKKTFYFILKKEALLLRSANETAEQTKWMDAR